MTEYRPKNYYEMMSIKGQYYIMMCELDPKHRLTETGFHQVGHVTMGKKCLDAIKEKYPDCPTKEECEKGFDGENRCGKCEEADCYWVEYTKIRCEGYSSYAEECDENNVPANWLPSPKPPVLTESTYPTHPRSAGKVETTYELHRFNEFVTAIQTYKRPELYAIYEKVCFVSNAPHQPKLYKIKVENKKWIGTLMAQMLYDSKSNFSAPFEGVQVLSAEVQDLIDAIVDRNIVFKKE